MPYAPKLYAYFFVWFTAGVVIGHRYLVGAGLLIVLAIGLIMSLAMIYLGRWLLNCKHGALFCSIMSALRRVRWDHDARAGEKSTNQGSQREVCSL